jgi:hypothetical protein
MVMPTMEPRRTSVQRWIGVVVVVCVVTLLLPVLSVAGFSPSSGGVAAAISKTAAGSHHHHHPRTSSRLYETKSDIDNSNNTPPVNPNKPELPFVAGDYDWDAKFGNDPDWLIGSAVPGKGKLSDLELAKQATALGGLEDKWRRERDIIEYENSAKTGFVPKAELLNGRSAMFFLVTGLLTEYWTGVSIPGQVEELLRIAGVIGFD